MITTYSTEVSKVLHDFPVSTFTHKSVLTLGNKCLKHVRHSYTCVSSSKRNEQLLGISRLGTEEPDSFPEEAYSVAGRHKHVYNVVSTIMKTEMKKHRSSYSKE